MDIRFGFQPIVDLFSGETVGYEALLRLGGVSPKRVFRKAWSVGQEAAFDLECVRWAVMTAPDLQPGAALFINLRPATLVALADGSAQLVLPEGRRPPLVFELLETPGWPRTYAECERVRKAIRPYGVLCLDDVGTGWPDTTPVLWLRPRWIKVSIPLVQGAAGDRATFNALRSLVRSHLGLTASMIAMGIENQDQWTSCRSLGIGYGQGYFFAPPIEGPPLPKDFLPGAEPRTVEHAGEESIQTAGAAASDEDGSAPASDEDGSAPASSGTTTK